MQKCLCVIVNGTLLSNQKQTKPSDQSRFNQSAPGSAAGLYGKYEMSFMGAKAFISHQRKTAKTVLQETIHEIAPKDHKRAQRLKPDSINARWNQFSSRQYLRFNLRFNLHCSERNCSPSVGILMFDELFGVRHTISRAMETRQRFIGKVHMSLGVYGNMYNKKQTAEVGCQPSRNLDDIYYIV